MDTATLKRPTNVSLDAGLVAAAKELGVNVSQACERGLKQQISDARNKAWIEENRDAMDTWNSWIDGNGLPLYHLRQF